VKNSNILEKFEQDLIRNSKNTFEERCATYEKLYHEALALGAFETDDLLEKLESRIRMVKILNNAERGNKSL
jgi:hypothetical protein